MGDSPPCPEASGNLERSNFRCKYLQPTMLSAFQQILYSNFDVVVDRFGFTRTSQQRECQSNEGPKLIKLLKSQTMPFDSKRMAYGGFKVKVDAS